MYVHMFVCVCKCEKVCSFKVAITLKISDMFFFNRIISLISLSCFYTL